MTKGELRKARKQARADGLPLGGELALDRGEREGQPVMEFSETPRGRRGLERWARYYDSLNGAPEGDWDR